MKKIFCLILALVIAFSLAACGRKKNEEMPTEEETNTETLIEEETTEEIIDETEEDVKEDVKVEKNEEIKNENKEDVKNEDVEEGEKTLGNILLSYFKENASTKSIDEIAQGISELPVIEFSCMTAPMEEGYLAGFDEEIHGFTKAVSFAPMIGSIPFVGYIFETDDADGLIASLKASANLRWNICVEADEMVYAKAGNKVFFVMCPASLTEAE